MELKGFKSNYERGDDIKSFGEDVTTQFLGRNNLSLLVRSHQLQTTGFQEHHNGKCWTVFSAPNYCGRYGNRAAVLRLTHSDSKKIVVSHFDSAVL